MEAPALSPTPRPKGDEIYGQLIPIDGDSVLLPNSAVVEVRGVDEVEMRMDVPGWMLGTLTWREHELPVVSLEGLMGREVPPRSRRTRLLVINSLGTSLTTPIFAFVTQGYPHLAALNRKALQATQREKRDPPTMVLSRVRVANTLAIIPDLFTIEQKLAEVAGKR